MKFSMNQSELHTAINAVLKGVSTRSTLPILSGILVDTKQDEVIFQATDLEVSMQYAALALIEEQGKTVLPAKLVNDIVKNFPDSAITIETESSSAKIYCDTVSFEVKTLNPQDFPEFPQVIPDQTIQLSFPLFSSMIKSVVKSAAKTDSTPIHMGVLITTNEDVLRMVATDSYRLSIVEHPLTKEIEEGFSAVIQASFLQDVVALQPSEEMVYIGVSDNQIIIKYQNSVLINRRLEGVFPNYKQIIPSGHSLLVTVDREKLLTAIRRASVLNTAATPIKFYIDPQTGVFQICASSLDVGSIHEMLSCSGEGESAEIAFNSSYLIDGLSSIDCETLSFEMQTPQKPGILKAEKSFTYNYFILPIRLT